MQTWQRSRRLGGSSLREGVLDRRATGRTGVTPEQVVRAHCLMTRLGVDRSLFGANYEWSRREAIEGLRSCELALDAPNRAASM